MQEQIITIQIGNKIYEKICTCINGVFKSLPQTYLKNKFTLIEESRYPSTYTQDMEDKSIKIKAAKRIIKQNKLIDFQRFLLKNIINTNNQIEFIIFICKQLNNYKPINKIYEQQTRSIRENSYL